MSPRSRAAFSAILALFVALPLLPTALDDDAARADAEPTETEDPAGATTTTSTDPAVTTTSSSTSTTSTTPTSSSTSSTTSTSSTVPPPTSTDGGGGTPPTAPPPTSSGAVRPAELAVNAVGDLVQGRRGSIAVTLAAGSVGGTFSVTTRVVGATIVDLPEGCSPTAGAAVCTAVAGAGSTSQLVLGLDVEGGAATVEVQVEADLAGGPDPTPIAASFATTSAGAGLSSRYYASGSLDVSVVGNTLSSCASGTTVAGVSCESVRSATASAHRTNDSWPAAPVQADARAGGSSSGAQLATGGAAVDQAYLVWGASTTTTAPPGAAAIRFASPATTGGAAPSSDAAYAVVAANETLSVPGAWQSIADVTSMVAGAGDGTYWAADIAADLGGSDAWAGWSLVVVHAGAGPSDVIVLDGLVDVADTAIESPLPTASTAAAPQVGVVLWDGDDAVTGEQLWLEEYDGAASSRFVLGDVLNPGTDVGNSTITRGGAVVPGRVPAYDGTLGVDVDGLSVPPIETSDLRFGASSSGDDVLVGLVVVELGL